MTTRTFAKANEKSDIGFLHWREGARQQHLEIGEFLLIGRDPTSNLAFNDNFVSQRHARVEKKTEGFLLRDLRSRNGTYLNGARVFEALLDDGDRIRIGNSDLTFTWQREHNPLTSGCSSQNIKWNEQLQRLPNIARSQHPVLLIGPSGTGKEVLAHSVHRLSARGNGPFVSVNCSALTESLVESELFGHVKGSFTGATNDRKGAFEAARGGTLFLDEVGDLPLSLQPKLLRALENCQIRPVGSDRDITTDVRIVAATHHNLKMKVREEKFREDLYFRLAVIHLQTPRLRERMEDFEQLFYFFAKQQRVRFSFGAIQRLRTYSWPGNIRELKNAISRAKAFFPEIEITELQIDDILDHAPGSGGESCPATKNLIREMEHDLILKRLIANKGNQRRTAADLGMAKSTLHDRIKKFGINLKEISLL